jgi:hypothetical protein
MEAFFVLLIVFAVMVALGSVVAREGSRSRSRANRPGGYYDSGIAHTGGSVAGSTGGGCDSGSGWSGGDSGGGFSGGGDGGGSSC